MRLLAGALAVPALIVPAVSASANDDPMPPDWPAIADPGDSGAESDPQPRAWPTVVLPQVDSDDDPVPPDWPAPSPG